MQGLWKPLVAGLGLSVLVTVWSGVVVDRSGLEPFVAVTLSTLALVGILLVPAMRPASSFVRGMRQAAPHIQVTKDRVNWWGERHLTIRSPHGKWRVRTELSRGGRGLYVRSPTDLLDHRVRGPPYEAGYAAMLASQTGRRPGLPEPAAGAPLPVPRLPGGRATARLLLVPITALVAVALAGLMALAGTPFVEALARATTWTLLGAAWFLATVGGTTLAWEVAEPRAARLGRAGAGASLLVGIGLGQAAVALVTYMGHTVVGGPPLALLPVAGLALGATLCGRWALAEHDVPVRTLTSVGALLAAGASLLLPFAVLTLLSLVLTGNVLFQTWTTAPPTRASQAA